MLVDVRVENGSKVLELGIMQRADDVDEHLEHESGMTRRVSVLGREHFEEGVEDVLQEFDDFLSLLKWKSKMLKNVTCHSCCFLCLTMSIILLRVSWMWSGFDFQFRRDIR